MINYFKIQRCVKFIEFKVALDVTEVQTLTTGKPIKSFYCLQVVYIPTN